MTQPHDALTMNACLARVIGATRIEKRKLLNVMYRVSEVEEDCYILENGEILCGVSFWNPLHDANQMELVEAELEKTCNFEYVKYVENKIWACHLWTNAMREAVVGADPGKKRAFALAVYAMEQTQKDVNAR